MKATISPILLNSMVNNLKPGAKLGPADIGKIGLYNPLREPLLANEIRFSVPSSFLGMKFAVQADIKFGRFQITQQPVPIGLLGRALDKASEPNNTFWTSLWNLGQVYAAVYVWRFPKPIYVAPEEGFDVSLYYDTSMQSISSGNFESTINVGVSVACRPVSLSDPVPKVIPLPYACAWVDTPRVGGVDYLNITAPVSTLRNAYAKPMFVQRMTGSYLYAVTSTSNLYQSEDVFNVGDDTLGVKLSASDGRIVARDYVPFNNAFSILDRSWDLKTVLPPQGFFELQAQAKMRSAAVTDYVQMYSTLIGHHMIDCIDGVPQP
jgi:hypothetical protein